MRIRYRGMFVGMLLAALMPWSATSLPGQEPSTPKATPRQEAPPVRKGYDPCAGCPTTTARSG